MIKKLKERNEINNDYKWDIEDLYSSHEDWVKDAEDLRNFLERLKTFKGRLRENPTILLEAFTLADDTNKKLERLYSYAHMNLDVDTRAPKSQELFGKANALITEVDSAVSFIKPEILNHPDSFWMEYIEIEPKLKPYKHSIKNILRSRDNILDQKQETMMTYINDLARTPYNTYTMLNNADIEFPNIENEEGESVELSQGNFISYMENKDREVRKKAFQSFYKTYDSFKNTLSSNLTANLKSLMIIAKLRNYENSLVASLDVNNIDKKVYENLIAAVNEQLPSMHQYMSTRKRILGYSELHMYDIYVPLVGEIEDSYSYEEAKEMVIEGLSILGKEYKEGLNKAFSERWIDVYENKGKRSGAYSGGCYGSKPYILLNYNETLDNVFTLAHELGHSMHSYFNWNTQDYINSGISIFIAEVASTVNELLLLNHLLKNTSDKNRRKYLINHYLESFRGTVFRQTMFAEFEKLINEKVSESGSLTYEYLNVKYRELNAKYYGEDMVIDDEIDIEWSRIPHFYYNFYVYQYATGFSAAVSIAEDILSGKENAIENYINMLKAGASDYPIEVMKIAGLDMNTKEPVEKAMRVFGELVKEFDDIV